MDKTKKREIIADVLEKVKVFNVGEKNNYDSPCCVEKSESTVYYPSLYLSSEQAPFLTNYEVGDEILLVVKAELTSHSLDENKDKSKESFVIKVKEIGCDGNKGDKEYK